MPDDAVYDPEQLGWEVSVRDAAGVRQGEVRLYRPDGSLARVCSFEGGKKSGPFSSFHPSGEVASRGAFVDDRLDGTFFRFVSSAPGGEPLRHCCVPPGAVELRAEYKGGRFVNETFYDETGAPLAPDGSRWPARPAGVPASARFDERSSRYVDRIEDEDGSRATLRYFSADGVCVEELPLLNGIIVGRRRFDERGKLASDYGFDERGVAHGPSRLRFEPDSSPLDVPEVCEVVGEHFHGEATGVWCLLDASGECVRSVERGTPFSEPPAVVLEREPASVTGDELFERAAEARDVGQAREALCLAARGAVRLGDGTRFREFLRVSVMPQKVAPALEHAESIAAAGGVTASRLLDAALGGADLPRIFRALASTLPANCAASLDYLDAALLLAPDRTMTRVARGMARLEHGDRTGALADADAVEKDSPVAASFMREECRVAACDYGFVPLVDPVAEPEEELLPVVVEQPLAAVQHGVALYATRLGSLRAELRARLGDGGHGLPPDVASLLPNGPVELRRFTARIRDETDDGFEETDVEVDESLAPRGLSVRELWHAARADWAALSWLCWAVGLDRVGMPTRVEPPRTFPAAVNRASLRCFWAHDRLRTGGLVAMSRKVAPFEWEGLPVESLATHLANVAAAEYRETRAVLLWLLFEQNVSPFQADLRKV